MKLHDIEIRFSSPAGKTGEVTIDGKPVMGLTAIRVDADVNGLVTVQLTMLPHTLGIRFHGMPPDAVWAHEILPPERVVDFGLAMLDVTTVGDEFRRFAPQRPS